MRLIWGREPAVFWAMVANVAMAVLLLFPLDENVQGALNAAILAAAGFLTAAWVSVDAALPALVGLIKAGFAALLAFGTPLPDNVQVGILAIVTAAGAFFVRQQVTARVPAALPVLRAGE
jgi:hypothetical protein